MSRILFSALIAIGLMLAFISAAWAQDVQYIGEVYIIGNSHTPDGVIRARLDLCPGQVLRYPEIRLAERNLNKTNWFLVDEKNDIRPTVTVLDNKGLYKDIVVKVQERPGNWARLAFWDVVHARNTMDYRSLVDAAHLVNIGFREWREKRTLP